MNGWQAWIDSDDSRLTIDDPNDEECDATGVD